MEIVLEFDWALQLVTDVRRFVLHRDVDPSGVSGTGVVAEGIEFSSGVVVISFMSTIINVRTAIPYSDLADMYLVHGHKGKTRIVWVDSE